MPVINSYIQLAVYRVRLILFVEKLFEYVIFFLKDWSESLTSTYKQKSSTKTSLYLYSFI